MLHRSMGLRVKKKTPSKPEADASKSAIKVDTQSWYSKENVSEKIHRDYFKSHEGKQSINKWVVK